MERQSASPEAGPSRGRAGKRGHRACDYCRAHRIKCVPVEGDARCRRCLDSEMPCDKLSAPPKDLRPRRRFLFRGTSSNGISQSQGVEASYLGESSLALLAWKYAPQRSEVIDKFRVIDDRHELYRGSIGGLEQDGLLVGISEEDPNRTRKEVLISLSIARSNLILELGKESVLAALYETCRDRIIPLFPIISVSESLLADKASDEHVAKYASVDRNPPTPLPHMVRMIHCAIAATSREVPQDVRNSVLTSLHRLLAGPEMAKIAATRCLGTVQVLILLSMCEDLNGPNAVGAGEAVWQNVGSAIRIGFGIGLHRNISPAQVPYFQLNRRLRVWGACVAMDRWQTMMTGRGFAINLADCDAPLPRNYADGIREGETGGSIFPCFRFLAEFTRLSILLGRSHALLATPSGLQGADDLSLHLLQLNIDSWVANLPSSWRYSIHLHLDQAPNLMNLFAVALEFTFQRCFLWPTSPVPNHVTFRPTRDRWQSLRQRAEQAVYWLNTTDGAFYLDVWSVCIYPAFCCVIIFLKAFEEFNDPNHKWLLNLADDVVQQWAMLFPENPIRSRLAAMSGLLRSVAETNFASPSLVHNLFDTNGIDDQTLDPIGFGHLAFDGTSLDPMWFELV